MSDKQRKQAEDDMQRKYVITIFKKCFTEMFFLFPPMMKPEGNRMRSGHQIGQCFCIPGSSQQEKGPVLMLV